jgi:hypothetical protein
MTGHFEKGAWIEDPKLPPEPMVMRVRIDVDDTQVQRLKATLEECEKTIDRIRAKSPGDFTNPDAICGEKDGKT